MIIIVIIFINLQEIEQPYGSALFWLFLNGDSTISEREENDILHAVTAVHGKNTPRHEAQWIDGS